MKYKFWSWLTKLVFNLREGFLKQFNDWLDFQAAKAWADDVTGLIDSKSWDDFTEEEKQEHKEEHWRYVDAFLKI